jgi:hypothetical protein
VRDGVLRGGRLRRVPLLGARPHPRSLLPQPDGERAAGPGRRLRHLALGPAHRAPARERAPVPALAAPPDLAPWALQLASGRRCVRTTGATTTVRGRRLSYVCDGHRVLFGRPQAETPTWRIRQARDTGGHAARDVAIAMAWR